MFVSVGYDFSHNKCTPPCVLHEASACCVSYLYRVFVRKIQMAFSAKLKRSTLFGGGKTIIWCVLHIINTHPGALPDVSACDGGY